MNDDVVISGLNTTDNKVQGNYIGLNATGTAAIPNNNDGVGVFANAQNNTIGGTSPGTRNFISGHAGYGVAVGNPGTAANSIQGNTIGLNALNSPVPNASPGVAFFDSAQSSTALPNVLGGTAPGASNLISGNSNEGVAVYSLNSTTIKETISRNSITGNGGKGIALYNGGNNSQAFPTIATAVVSTVGNPNGTDSSGSLAVTANITYTIEFFASPSADPSGFGEGQFFIGTTTVTSNASGTVNFSASLAAAVPAGYVIAATATDSAGNTSEFSAIRTVALTDSDSDRIPDAWLNARFGHNTGQAGDKSRASDDADGDGLTNLQEYRAGTDPRSATNALRISAIDKISNGFAINFPSVTDKTYRLEYRDDLVTGSWNTLVDQMLGTGGTLQISDLAAAGSARRFYRIAIEP